MLSSNWLAADTSKQTTLEYDGVVTEHVGHLGEVGRKEAHCRGVYDVLLSDPSDSRLGVPLATELARVLETASAAPPAAVRWSTTGRA